MSVPPNPNPLDRQVGRSAFGQDATGYDLARSGYPAALFDLLAGKIASKPRIAEIGSGTGLASVGLLRLGPGSMTMIEPDPRLCEFLHDRFGGARARVVCAPFPDVEIDGPFDLVACAAAFHWMEPRPALAKVRSMLAPRGIWAMWWNSYFGHGISNPFTDRLAQIVREAGVALSPSYRDGRHYAFDVDHHFEVLGRAGFIGAEHHLFQREVSYTAQQAVALCRSFSFVSVLPEVDRDRLLDRIAVCVDHEFGGSASGLVATALYTARSD